MQNWENISGSEIIDSCIEDENVKPRESEVEDAYKQSWLLASKGELKLLKLYYTDGFGWYYNRKTHKLVFVLHECKVIGVGSEFKTVKFKNYKTCIRKALLQAIGYYYKIKNKQYTSFSKELKNVAKEFDYDDVNKFIIDHFGLFLITCPNFVGHVKFSEVKDLVKELEEPIRNSEVSPSKYWSDKNSNMKQIMEAWDADEASMIPTKDYDTSDTQKVLNEVIIEQWN